MQVEIIKTRFGQLKNFMAQQFVFTGDNLDAPRRKKEGLHCQQKYGQHEEGKDNKLFPPFFAGLWIRRNNACIYSVDYTF